MESNQFKKDLMTGLMFETNISNKLLHITEVENSQEFNKDFDISLPEMNMTIEAKFDKASDVYDNYAIETRFEAQPSGIMSTKSDVWIQGNSSDILILNTASLKKMVSEMKTITRDIQGKDVALCLIKKDLLRMNGTVLQYSATPDELLSAIIEEGSL